MPRRRRPPVARVEAPAANAPAPGPAVRPELVLSEPVLEAIRSTVGRLPSEEGGALGGRRDEATVTAFHLDSTADRSGVTYSPDVATINRLFSEWNERGIRLAGFVHSHPPGARAPSPGDREYATRILAAIPSLGALHLPIVESSADGVPFAIHPYAAVRSGDGVAIVAAGLRVIRAAATQPEGLALDFPLVDRERPPAELTAEIRERYARAVGRAWPTVPGAFDRTASAYDIPRLARSRIVAVGLGGARGLVVDLARAGVREFVLIDPDIVAAPNPASQSARYDELGRRKVDAVRDEIRAVAPGSEVRALARRVEDLRLRDVAALARRPIRRGIGVSAAGRLFVAPLPPERTVLLGMTDSFAAQAQVNRLGLALGIPSVCAQLYAGGLAGEVTFAWPGVVPACHRCMLAARYRAYEAGFRNDVTSVGSPIFAAGRVNATAGFIATAILHRGSDHPRWGGLLERLENRSLAQIRMDPTAGSVLGLGVFDRVLRGGDTGRIAFDETVWVPCERDADCPDCRPVAADVRHRQTERRLSSDDDEAMPAPLVLA